jgi:hypothetical protein
VRRGKPGGADRFVELRRRWRVELIERRSLEFQLVERIELVQLEFFGQFIEQLELVEHQLVILVFVIVFRRFVIELLVGRLVVKFVEFAVELVVEFVGRRDSAGGAGGIPGLAVRQGTTLVRP